ncbi:MAG: ParB/RepB/Spo0J family partition protein [Vicinamibacteria bacterium]|nr:ParB/RepB/Spo0J family partition protein [Vicinamibacteria bacterium]
MSNVKRAGLPSSLRMRHDSHFIDQLGRAAGSPIGQSIPIEDIDPNPNQPRQNVGDLSELIASIREKGVLEPIIVRRKDSRFQIVAGERRYRAAIEAGLPEIPSVVKELSDPEVMEIALIENLQRKDLTAFEEADGLKVLAESHGYTHEMMAEKLGKSRTTVTETLTLSSMPDRVRELCRLADISSKSVLIQVVRQQTPEKMVAFIDTLQKTGVGPTRAEARRLIKAVPDRKGRPKNFVFTYKTGRDRGLSLSLKFGRSDVSKSDIVAALEELTGEIKSKDPKAIGTRS